jgi:hypothetical protein
MMTILLVFCVIYFALEGGVIGGHSGFQGLDEYGPE